jgi:hypothetical protein
MRINLGREKMFKRKNKSLIRIVFSRILGLLIFLVFLYFANRLSFFTKNPINYGIIQLLNDNIGLIVLITVIFMLGEIFNTFTLPFNFAGPLINAVGSILLLTLLFRIVSLLDFLLGMSVFSILGRLSFLIYPFVFLIVLIFGYIGIFTRNKDAQK